MAGKALSIPGETDQGGTKCRQKRDARGASMVCMRRVPRARSRRRCASCMCEMVCAAAPGVPAQNAKNSTRFEDGRVPEQELRACPAVLGGAEKNITNPMLAAMQGRRQSAVHDREAWEHRAQVFVSIDTGTPCWGCHSDKTTGLDAVCRGKQSLPLPLARRS